MGKRAVLKHNLDRLYETYDFKDRVKHDPISIPARFKNKIDIECSALIASAFAYGQVGVFMPAIDRVMDAMDNSPAAFIMRFNPKSQSKLFHHISYRFYKPLDVAALIFVINKMLKRDGGMEPAFMRHYDDQKNIRDAMSGFVEEIMHIDTSPVYGKNIKPAGFRFMFPSPLDKSPCKRLNLYLRWMVRSADIDFGLWKRIPQNKLIIPLDTHIGRVSRCLGLTKRASNDWRTAEEITESLRAFDPDDPLKYDFSLCHRGIAGLCAKNKCGECGLKEYIFSR